VELSTCNVILRRVHESTVAVERNYHYVFLGVCMRARVCEGMHMRQCVCVWGGG
jgi:hypothetical protein